jgi:hypothetical protein
MPATLACDQKSDYREQIAAILCFSGDSIGLPSDWGFNLIQFCHDAQCFGEVKLHKIYCQFLFNGQCLFGSKEKGKFRLGVAQLRCSNMNL